MDAYDQLLLSEEVCRQLGIINYRPDVHLFKQKQKAGNKNEEKEKESIPVESMVRIVEMMLWFQWCTSGLFKESSCCLIKVHG